MEFLEERWTKFLGKVRTEFEYGISGKTAYGNRDRISIAIPDGIPAGATGGAITAYCIPEEVLKDP